MPSPESCVARAASLLVLAGMVVGAGIARSQTGQPVCIPEVPPGVVDVSDASTAGDWDTFTPLTVEYAGAALAEMSTQLAHDGTDLYFITQVETPLASLPILELFLGIRASNRMIRIRPFTAGDLVPLPADQNVAFIDTAFTGWTVWTAPPSTDFSRRLDLNPESWTLEGRIDLSAIGISDVGNFDLFLHVNASHNLTTVERYWPAQTPIPDLGDPGTLAFGAVRCPGIVADPTSFSFAMPFGGDPEEKTVQIENAGSAGLEVTGIEFPSSTPFDLVSFTEDDTGQSPTFTLEPAETATVTVSYDRVTCTPMAPPDQATLTITSDDPDTPRLDVDMSGEVFCPDIVPDPASLDFGILPLFSTQAMTIEIKNVGDADSELIVTDVSLAGDPELAIESISPLPTFTLGANGTATVSVRYSVISPSCAETFLQATLTVVSNDPDTPSLEIPITGEILCPSDDCNSNGVPDDDDIANGTSEDINEDGKPDECQNGRWDRYIDGTAQGGTIRVDVGGFLAFCTVTVSTQASDPPETVAADLADALNNDPCFTSQGFEAMTPMQQNQLCITGFLIDDRRVHIESTDPGLQIVFSIVKIPTLSSLGLALLALLLAAYALVLLRGRRSPRGR